MNIPPVSWLNSNVSVEASPINRLGLFARMTLRGGGEVVAVLGGTMLSDHDVTDKLAAGTRYDGVVLAIDVNLTIEPEDWPGIHGNHSCDPNLWMGDAVTIIARRDIQRGEELTTDYAMYTVSPTWMMSCCCASTLCRRVLTGADCTLPELQERYRGHFSPVVQELIEATP